MVIRHVGDMDKEIKAQQCLE